MERDVWHYYQLPAALRSLGRLSAQMILLKMLGRIMEWMVGLGVDGCLTESGGCHFWCGVLWIVAVVGTGHAGAAAIAVWGGPLRIRNLQSSQVERPSAKQIFTRPWQLLRWMRDPDQRLREIAIQRRGAPAPLKPFHPDPLQIRPRGSHFGSSKW